MTARTETATFGSGCFWCTEAIFQQLNGVVEVVSGYSGGKVKNPSYREVCSGRTGHAEVVKVVFDPDVIAYADLLDVFWSTHDPTTRDRQGADVGTQYRSVVFYHDDRQRELAETAKENLNQSGAFKDPVVTEISPATAFYPAEGEHQNYFNEHGNAPYCAFVIQPKLNKFKKKFASRMKEQADSR